MLRSGSILAVLAVVAMLAAPAGAQDDAASPDWEKLLADKADTVVSIKFVVQIKVLVQGQMRQEVERNQEVRGVLINDNGLVLTSNSNFGAGRHPNPMVELQAGAPRDVKVLFGREEKEYEAQIVAKDTKIDLAFLQIMDLGDRKISSVSLATENDPRVGQELFTVGRLARGFDNTPMLGKLAVTAAIEKPRRMWAFSGATGGPGLPAYDLTGKPVGIMVTQEGSQGVGGERAGNMWVIIPLKSIQAQLKQADERAAKALEEAADKKEEAGEGEEKPADEKPADEQPADEQPDDAPEKPEKPEGE